MDVVRRIDVVDDTIAAFMAQVVAGTTLAAGGPEEDRSAPAEERLLVLKGIEVQTGDLDAAAAEREAQIKARHVSLMRTIDENLAASMAVAERRQCVDRTAGVVDQTASATLEVCVYARMPLPGVVIPSDALFVLVLCPSSHCTDTTIAGACAIC